MKHPFFTFFLRKLAVSANAPVSSRLRGRGGRATLSRVGDYSAAATFLHEKARSTAAGRATQNILVHSNRSKRNVS
ncbi:hypothetical protein V5799_024922 [Amblyomma americanum]|uniref:Uncharacterized protein n=1 Tax=Amblyomma americanum TaxID=6943 RepID=A0AAQ4EAT5_AMBAM